MPENSDNGADIRNIGKNVEEDGTQLRKVHQKDEISHAFTKGRRPTKSSCLDNAYLEEVLNLGQHEVPLAFGSKKKPERSSMPNRIRLADLDLGQDEYDGVPIPPFERQKRRESSGALSLFE